QTVRLLKLHGSINWHLFRFPEWDQFASVESDPDFCRDQSGSLLETLDPKPAFLTGTSVKEQVYGTGLFGELFSKFRELLSRHRTLICCGYGWSDKGINIRLNQWLRDTKENKLVILNADSLETIQRKRFWFWRWDDYARLGKVTVVPKWLSNCSTNDLA